jgi:hypothetical protein
MDLDDFSKRILEPAMNVLAANIESDAFSMYKDVYNQVNNTGSAATFAKLLAGRKILVDNLAPPGDLNVCLNTQDNVDLVDALKGLFHSQKEISKQYRDGYLGRTAGFDFMENTVIPAHTRGAANTSYTTDTRVSALPLVSTAVSSITVASGSGAVAIGDVFTIANVFRVHPETKVSTGVLQQFVATAVMASAGTTLSISPSIILAGPKQNVTIPSTSATAALTWAGTLSTAHGISLAFHRDAFAFATADLVMPEGVDFAARKVLDGISMRIVRAYDINNDNFPCRLDVLYGYKTLRPQIACRLANN